MLNITHHHGNANQNHNGITSRLSEWLESKRQEIASVGKDMEKKEHSCPAGENINWSSHVKNNMEVPQKIKYRNTI